MFRNLTGIALLAAVAACGAGERAARRAAAVAPALPTGPDAMHAMPTHADPTLAPLQAPSPSSSLETATFALG